MPELEVNETHTVSIDSTGEVATFDVKESHAHDETIGLNIDGTEATDYAVDLGGPDGNGGITWFTGEVTYSSTAEVRDGWQQAEKYIRIRVTTAASSGSEATIYLARGT